MLYISYCLVCELEAQILLTGDLCFIEKGELGTAKKDIAEIERMLKALIKYRKQTLDRTAPRKYRLLRKGRGEL